MCITETMRFADFEWATKLNRLALNIAGIWPNADKNACDRFLSDLRAMFSLFLFIFIGAIPAIHALLRIRDDMMAIIDNLQFTLPLLTTIIKVIVIWWKKTDLTLALKMIADDWLKIKTNKELRVMIKHAQNARAIIMFGYVLMIVGFILLAILPCFGKSLRYITNVTDTDKVLPLQTYYLYNKNQSPYFELTFAAQSLMLLIAGASYSGVDNLLGLLIFHLCGQMENLKKRLINMKHKAFNTVLALIVNDHIRLIKFRVNFDTLTTCVYFNIVESTFTLLLLTLLCYFGTLFCLYGFLIVTILTEKKEMSMMRFIYLISVALNICGHMCLYCVVGEVLIAQCEGIYHAAYDYEWYKLHPQEAKTLLLIMIRASKPLHITAGKMFPMTLSMFCNLIKTSAGYVSVLLARQSL